MSWSDLGMQSPFQSLARHRPALLRVDDSDLKCEEKGDDNTGTIFFMGRYPETTHVGRMASVFSDRMPCTGMYGAHSHPHDTAFAMAHDIDSTGDSPSELPSLEASDSVSSNYGVSASMDMQQFDDNNDVDLQQLFPSTASMAFMPTSLNAAVHGGIPSASDGSFLPHSSPQSARPSDHGLDTSDQFPEAYPPLPPSDANTTMLMSFPFSSTPASFDDTDDLAGTTGDSSKQHTMDIQEVTHLFHNNAVLMTPPTAITIPRTTIVSPINSMSLTRSALQPPVTRSAAMDTKSGLQDLQEDATPRFSLDRRKLCNVEGCRSQARAFNRCKRHGGSKRCSHPGCTKSVQSRGLCIRHGGGSRCQEAGCTRAAQSHGKCKMHGGGRPCVVLGCEKKAHLKRLCRKHGGGAKCSVPECDKWAQRQGMCMTHSKHQTMLVESPPPEPAKPPSSSSSKRSMFFFDDRTEG